MAKKNNQPKRISNRRASFDYELGDSLVVGIELTGAEVKSLRTGRGHLRGAYVTFKGNEIFLINATITGSVSSPIEAEKQTRARKLLAKRKEIDALIAARQQSRTIVPLEILNGGRFIKVRIALGKGRKNYDKRTMIKARDDFRQMGAAIKLRK